MQIELLILFVKKMFVNYFLTRDLFTLWPLLYSRTSRKRTPLGPDKVAAKVEVSAYERLKMLCLYVAGYMTRCPLRRGVRLREVSVSGGSTVVRSSVKARTKQEWELTRVQTVLYQGLKLSSILNLSNFLWVVDSFLSFVPCWWSLRVKQNTWTV